MVLAVSGFSAKMAATAARLIAKFGGPATLLKAGAASGDPWSPTIGDGTSHAITAVDLEHRLRDRSGTLIGTTARTLYIAATDVEPDKADRVTIGGETHEIAVVRRLAPAGTAIMFEVDLVN